MDALKRLDPAAFRFRTSGFRQGNFPPCPYRHVCKSLDEAIPLGVAHHEHQMFPVGDDGADHAKLHSADAQSLRSQQLLHQSPGCGWSSSVAADRIASSIP